ncbi:DUF4145 domain-containing protein [Pseudomonas aeruginosa]|uniref:DUF4145 domain-containing protein n=1 Tax=Pseudomonas aeruginosa TaxID=287 RepID=UPI0021E4F2DF|nr:DUF4145 domain-containing protein [Pseudomonas aeruginosa]MCV2469149.1 DUF4145 domain-containing protein [Pseudomonas aeruginosa]MCV2475493.1 DUF4145 domain-containing protein [Pseudomonas aeruginosa]MCV2481378.1 DUF4145 domain-containing protein [Pseudomonas aeruginosa]MDF5866920.1 DUF4145 domain-containing protein [Pseudomonas aeruginosa]HDQ4152932.1 DUF4145 domain-containing protein [Pseudomonas aeruginosa]
MDDVYFNTAFTQDAIPSYKCPACMKANLVEEEFMPSCTAYTRIHRGEDWWGPECEELIFRLTLKCPRCDDLVFVHGDGYIDEEITTEGEHDWSKRWVSYYQPKNFFPPLKFIDCPAATPREVQASLNSASCLYYSHPAAACNCLRMAAEDILTSLGVAIPEAGEFVSFGNRIKQLPEKSTEYNLLDAVRWLGNAGSHSGSKITHKDAEHAFTVIDLLIEEVYSDRKKKIHELAAAIREHKGPVGFRGF